jgi:hypothetical protein
MPRNSERNNFAYPSRVDRIDSSVEAKEPTEAERTDAKEIGRGAMEGSKARCFWAARHLLVKYLEVWAARCFTLDKVNVLILRRYQIHLSSNNILTRANLDIKDAYNRNINGDKEGPTRLTEV